MRANRVDAAWPQRGPAVGPGVESSTSVPARPASFVADVIVPVAQAAITGALLAGLVVFVLGELTDLDLDALTVWAGLALAISTAAWLWLLGQTRRLLWAVEKLTGLDLDGDQVQGDPRERVVIVNAADGQRQAQQRANAERASTFARFVAALPVKGTAARTWESELGRERYTEYRDVLLRCGWADWCSVDDDGRPNKGKGWSLSVPVGDILDRING